MQKTPDESGDRPTAAKADFAEGLVVDSREVTLEGGGWTAPIGRCLSFQLHPVSTTHGVEWQYLRFHGRFVLSQAAALLSIEGMPLQNLFPPDVYLRAEDIHIVSGPFVFLRGIRSEFSDPPLGYRDLVLAKVHQFPEGMSRESLLSLLIEHLPPSTSR